MGDFLEYPDVVQETRGAMHSGRLKMQSTGVVFRNLKTGKVNQFSAGEVEQVQWLKRAKGYCLKFILENGVIHRYDGFRDTEYPKLAVFLNKCYEKVLDKVDMSVKGWNWGLTKFVGNSLEFNVGKKADYKDMSKQKFEMAFEIPLPNVSSVTTGKNEVTMEFHQNDDAAVSLMEMRFHIPPGAATDDDIVEDFAKQVRKKADILQATGDAIAMFSEVQCLTPRGRYDIKLYATFLQLHGKTFDYKIPYSTVIRFFLLPHKDGRQVFFLIYLDPPIRQGQTRYPFLILLFNKDDVATVELQMSEEVLQEKYKGKLTQEMTGQEYEIVSKLMKALVDKRITVPGNFLSQTGSKALDCAYKNSNGFLYPLERSFIYLHKPPIFVRFDEIACVNFNRSSAKTKLFDFDVETKTGTVYNFSSIVKEEYGKLFDFIKMKQLKVKNIGGGKDNLYVDNMDSDEDTHDAYLERMKREGEEYETDDDDESTDEDFKPENAEGGSDVAEEFDSNPSSTSEEEEEGADGEPKKKKKKHKSAKTIPEPGTRSRRSKKAKKDPNMPKRPQSAYFLWLNHTREQIKEENPGISITEISKVAGEKWKTVTDKSKWETLALKAKEDYKEAKEDYEGTMAVGSKGSRDRKAKKDPNMPKRPQSAYFLWLNHTREQIKEENPGISITEISKVAGEKWKTVTDKSKWDGLAVKAKEDYQEAMAAYKADLAANPPSDSEEEEDSRKKTKKRPSSKPSNKSPKKPSSDSRASTGDYKSKEFISSSDSSDSDTAPVTKKIKKEPEAKKIKKEPEAKKIKKEEPKKKEPKKEAKKKVEPKKESSEEEEEEVESDVGSLQLPDDEEILSSPTASEASGSDEEEEDDDDDEDSD